jgi:hypothetical protein
MLCSDRLTPSSGHPDTEATCFSKSTRTHVSNDTVSHIRNRYKFGHTKAPSPGQGDIITSAMRCAKIAQDIARRRTSNSGSESYYAKTMCRYQSQHGHEPEEGHCPCGESNSIPICNLIFVFGLQSVSKQVLHS